MASAINSTTDKISSPDLKTHLEVRYNIKISRITQLDHNVFKVDRHDGPSWVARVFDPSLPTKIVEGDAETLRFLEQHNFPAERCANVEPLSTITDGRHVLVTDFVEGRRPRKGEQLFPKLGELLGRLHSLETDNTGAVARRGGAWHHLCPEGGPKEEVQAALAMLKVAEQSVQADQLEMYEKLKSKLEEMDDFEDLPRTFIHPDLVPPNVITANSGDLVVIDWAGSGTGPRIASLGFLLSAAGHRSMAQVKAVAEGYSKHVSLRDEELARLAGAVERPFVLRCWEFCTGRTKLEDVVGGISQMEELADRIAAVTCKVFRDGGGH